MSDPEKELLDAALDRVRDWETDMSEFFGLWNEWAGFYRMLDMQGEKRPHGVSRNITAETPRAVNALATSITRMQTAQDPYFELRSAGASEEALFDMERRYMKKFIDSEFKRKLLKGNRGMCLFGTQVWQEPYVQWPPGTDQPVWEFTDFVPLSLLQCAWETTNYDMTQSDFFATIHKMGGTFLRSQAYMGNGYSKAGIWNLELIEEAIKKGTTGDQATNSNSAIETRRQKAGYQERKTDRHELILWHGRIPDQENNEMVQKMWEQMGRTDDPRFCDLTFGILNREHIVRLHPTPYGTWRHMHKIGQYIEFELEGLGFGVGRLGGRLQKDMNNIMRYANDTAKFSLWNIFLQGRGGGLKSSNMNIFPWAVINADDVTQVQPLRPQVEGILNGLKLNEVTRDDFRAVTHATTTLQAVETGGTATEASLVSNEAMRAVSITAEVNADAVNRPHFLTCHKNEVDQNPYDNKLIRDVDFIAKTTTDKDYKPEYAKRLYDFLMLTTSQRQQMPIDFNPQAILEYFARSVQINPRELKAPRPQIDKMLDVLRRVNADSEMKRAMLGEEASMNNPSQNGPAPAMAGAGGHV